MSYKNSVIKNGTRCIRRYVTNCTPSVFRQMSKIAMAGVSKTINKRCSPEGIQNFLSHRQCIVSIKKPAQECYQNLVKDFYRIRQIQDKNLLHPSLCCYISKMHECNSNALKSFCKQDSQEEFYGQETGKLMDEIMELACPENLRWGQKDCNDLDSSLVPSLDDVKVGDEEGMTILSLVIDIMKKLQD